MFRPPGGRGRLLRDPSRLRVFERRARAMGSPGRCPRRPARRPPSGARAGPGHPVHADRHEPTALDVPARCPWPSDCRGCLRAPVPFPLDRPFARLAGLHRQRLSSGRGGYRDLSPWPLLAEIAQLAFGPLERAHALQQGPDAFCASGRHVKPWPKRRTKALPWWLTGRIMSSVPAPSGPHPVPVRPNPRAASIRSYARVLPCGLRDTARAACSLANAARKPRSGGRRGARMRWRAHFSAASSLKPAVTRRPPRRSRGFAIQGIPGTILHILKAFRF